MLQGYQYTPETKEQQDDTFLGSRDKILKKLQEEKYEPQLGRAVDFSGHTVPYKYVQEYFSGREKNRSGALMLEDTVFMRFLRSKPYIRPDRPFIFRKIDPEANQTAWMKDLHQELLRRKEYFLKEGNKQEATIVQTYIDKLIQSK